MGDLHFCLCLAAVALTILRREPLTLIIGIINAVLNWRSLGPTFAFNADSTWAKVNLTTGLVGSGLLINAVYLEFGT